MISALRRFQEWRRRRRVARFARDYAEYQAACAAKNGNTSAVIINMVAADVCGGGGSLAQQINRRYGLARR